MPREAPVIQISVLVPPSIRLEVSHPDSAGTGQDVLARQMGVSKIRLNAAQVAERQPWTRRLTSSRYSVLIAPDRAWQ